MWDQAHISPGHVAQVHVRLSPYGVRHVWVQAHLCRAHMGPSPLGSKTIWAGAHMALGPMSPGLSSPRLYRPKPMWARVHMSKPMCLGLHGGFRWIWAHMSVGYDKPRLIWAQDNHDSKRPSGTLQVNSVTTKAPGPNMR